MQFTCHGDDIIIRKIPHQDLIEVVIRGKKHLYERSGQELKQATKEPVTHEEFVIDKIRQYFIPAVGRKTYWAKKDQPIKL